MLASPIACIILDAHRVPQRSCLFRGWLKRALPSKERIREQRALRFFGELLDRPNLWHLNRHSVARAAAIGLFWAMVPMPFQMIPAALCAIRFRANLAMSMALVWLTNPLTMPPLYYAGYRVGRWLLGGAELAPLELTGSALAANLADIGPALYVGSIAIGSFLAVSAYGLVHLAWRVATARRWKRRAPKSVGASMPGSPT